MIIAAEEKRLKFQTLPNLITLQSSHDTGDIETFDTEPEQATILHTTSTGEDVTSRNGCPVLRTKDNRYFLIINTTNKTTQ